MNVCVIGLGYVGYPLAELCASKGHKVYGIDLSKKKIDSILKGIDPIEGKPIQQKFEVSTDNPGFVADSDVIIICVPTPVDKLKNPDLQPVISASEYTAMNLKKKSLVVVESTINPGVMEDVVKPIFDKHNLVVGVDYFLAHCPERINPGDPKWNVSNIPRVVGGLTSKCLDKAYDFYTSILSGSVMKMSNIRTAEATKIVENTFRDINIAFVNELAKSFSFLDIDTVEVIKGASTKPFAFLAHYPSCGVGGHCIPVDPYYLIERAKTKGFDHKFLKLAREINNSMPAYTVQLLIDALNDHKLSLNGTTIGVLGLSYKADVADLRESPSLEIINLLKKKGANVITYDPYIESDASSLHGFQLKCPFIILCTNHKQFNDLDFDKIKILIDGKNMFYDQRFKFTYRGIGR
ncbi:TPA: nucleotide sugar dehydrogenase [Candidatus Woesearchaeota archaeon]|nr:nucleotide sugar dehydrogenase [Candidatus Woesearchaeota archaeon]HIH54911.1 nucleotide sugar dehydrogenase [Candidatus Woesearchaeota archaeon]HIJ01798.1 nucleotide sugar dehydrogenase [Candidatus Woesearchaeota archaeon]HIJ14029.1 nucleotide sugar dehydrogenase [Candidatus Woesearchaeota archaeon]